MTKREAVYQVLLTGERQDVHLEPGDVQRELDSLLADGFIEIVGTRGGKPLYRPVCAHSQPIGPDATPLN